MLGSLDNLTTVGIEVVTDSRQVKKLSRKLDDLSKTATETTAGLIGLSQGSDKTSRSLNKLGGSSGTASTGLAGLQSQLISTRVAEESLENTTGDLNSSLRDLSSSTDNWSVGDIINEEQAEVLEASAKALDDMGVENAFSGDLDEGLDIDGGTLRSLEDYQKVVEKITGSGDGFSDDDRAAGLPSIDTVQDLQRELSKIESQTDTFERSDIWNHLFGNVDNENLVPADTTDPLFPQDSDVDTHIFADLFQSGDFDTVQDVLDRIESGDFKLWENISTGPLGSDGETAIGNLFPNDDLPEGRSDRALFSQMGDELQDEVHTALRSAGITTVDDIFQADDEVLNNALSDGVTKQGYSFGADDIRHEALRDLSEATSAGFEDLNEIEQGLKRLKVPEIGGDQIMSLLRRRRDGMSNISSRAKPKNLPGIAGAIEGFMKGHGIESVADIADADISELKNVKGLGTERAQEMKMKARNFQDLYDGLDNSIADGLLDLMDENEEVMDAMLEAGSFDEAIEAFQELDSDGLARLNTLLEEEGESLLDGPLAPDNVKGYLDTGDTKKDIQKKIQNTEGFGEFLNNRQIEMFTNIMSDLSGDSDDVVSPQNLTRETMGIRTLQEMLDTDPVEEQDRMEALRGIMENIYHPESGWSTTMMDDDRMMTEEFYPDLRDSIAENINPDFVNEGEFGEGDGLDIAEEITRKFRDKEGIGIEDFFGDDRESIGNYVGQAIDRFEIDDDKIIDRTSSEVEELLPQFLGLQAGRTASGLEQLSSKDGTVDLEQILPDQDILGMRLNYPDEVDEQQARQRLESNFEQYFEGLDKNLEQYRKVQESSPILQGGPGAAFIEEITGERTGKRGILGSVSGKAAGFTDSPRDFARLEKRLNGLTSKYKKLLPFLDATSLNLGALNVRFDTMGMMVFRLTTLLGPLITTLGGLASAGVVATGALGGLVGVGAVQYLEDMVDSMAGVSDKGEALEELGGVLKDMAWEALIPLRQARIGGDGLNGTQLFVETLRGGLQILNRMANILAYIIELDGVGEEAQRMAEFLLNSDGDMELMENLGYMVETILPVINDMVIGLMKNFDDFGKYAADITASLGGRFVDVLGKLPPLLGTIIAYGSGFFNAMLDALDAVLWLTSGLHRFIDTLLTVFNAIFGTNIEVKNIAALIGYLIGVLAVLSSVATIATIHVSLLAKSYLAASGAANIMTTSVTTLGAALKFAGLWALFLVSSIYLLYRGIEKLSNLEIGAEGWIKQLVAGISQIAAGLAILWKIGVLGPVFKGIAWVLGGIAGTVAGISAGTAAIVAAIVTLVVLLGDLALYLATGESYLLNWESHLARIADWIDAIREKWEALPFTDNNLTKKGARFEPYENRDVSKSTVQQRAQNSAGSGAQLGGSSNSMSANINVDASRSDRDLVRMIRKELDSWMKRAMGRDS